MQRWMMDEFFEEYFHQGTVAKLIALIEFSASVVLGVEIIGC